MFVLLITGIVPAVSVKFSWVTIHWIAGLVLTFAVALHIIRATLWQRLGDIWIGLRDVRDLGAMASSLFGPSDPPKPGKYSLAQKSFHNAIAVVILVAIVTGIIMMIGIDTPFWERDPYLFSEATRGLIFVLHGFAALISITMIMLHVYFAIRPEKLFYTRSMILGWITQSELEANHDPARWSNHE